MYLQQYHILCVVRKSYKERIYETSSIETATMLGGLAIMDGMTLVAESRINVKVTHSERLMKRSIMF